jgi:phospholipid/cholesterol/gamma-HCH transport system substrate-binding protein
VRRCDATWIGPVCYPQLRRAASFSKRSDVPSRKEIQWSQLKVGVLVLAAIVILIGLMFLMTGSTGGLFAHKITLRCYFPNAAGLKEGAVVSLEGVTIGNVTKMRVVPARNPTPVEVTMQVGKEYEIDLHTDSKASIQAAGVLGDSYVDIDSTHADGPPPLNNAELLPSGAPTIQSVINSSQVSIEEINNLMRKVETLIDSINNSRGAFGELINDPGLKKNITVIAANLQTMTQAIADGKGTAGKFITDDTLYNKMNSTVDQLNSLLADLNAGKGTAGKLLKDETAYNNFNSAVANLNQITASINAGNGTAGKLLKDPVMAQKLEDSISDLDSILKSVNAGEGTAGQFVKNKSLYNHADETLDEAHQLIKGMRENPKKYLVIQLKLF